jgi:hypothetical protein
VADAWLEKVCPTAREIDSDPIEVAEELVQVLREDFSKQSALYSEHGMSVELELGDYCMSIDVDESSTICDGCKITSDYLPTYRLDGSFDPGLPYGGRQQSLHEAYAFDVAREARFAWMLDNADRVSWWARNHPRKIRIETPAGFFSPDFVVH